MFYAEDEVWQLFTEWKIVQPGMLTFCDNCFLSMITTFNSRFPDEPAPLGPPAPRALKDNLCGLVQQGLIRAKYHFCDPVNIVEALHGTQSTNSIHWPDLILSLSTPRILMEETLLFLHHLSDAGTCCQT